MQIKIDDCNINYEVMGEGNPVILLHGWLANLDTMKPIANSLCSNFKVYLVDVIGFGKSDLPLKPLNSDDFGDFLQKFITKLNIENPILIGHSNGGRIIINAVGKSKVKPKKIVLMDSAGIIPKRSLKYYIKVYIAKFGKFILNILPRCEFTDQIKESVFNKLGSSDYKSSPQVLRETMKTIVSEDLTDLLPNIDVPTLLIWGTNDKDTPIEDGRKMEKLIKDCGMVEYAGSGHFAYLENIQNCNIVLNEFFKNDK